MLLCVWEEVPETTKFFLIEDEWKDCDGNFVGLAGNSQEEEDRLIQLSEYLKDKEELTTPFDLTEPTTVICCGMIT